jgi:hypothetical protein
LASAGVAFQCMETANAEAGRTNAANWDEGHAPNPGDDLVFPATSTVHATNNDLSADQAVSAIRFNGPGYTLSGNGIVSGEILCSSLVVGKNTINLPIAVNSVIVVGAQSACTLDLEGDIDGTGGIFSRPVAAPSSPAIPSTADRWPCSW